jgi:hypothetical protein
LEGFRRCPEEKLFRILLERPGESTKKNMRYAQLWSFMQRIRTDVSGQQLIGPIVGQSVKEEFFVECLTI